MGFLVFFSACATSVKKPELKQVLVETSAHSSFSLPESGMQGPEWSEGRSIVLILGPGFLRGFAYAGVLRVLADAHIPIGRIVGAQMGGFLGAIYATSRTINHFEWELQKMKDPLLLEKKIFFPYFSQKPSWKKFLGEKKFTEGSIALQIAVLEEGSVQWYTEGSLKDALELSLQTWSPEGKDPREKLRRRWMKDLLTQVRHLELGPIVWVDVFGDSSFGLSHLVDVVIRPDRKHLGLGTEAKKAEFIFYGKKATLEKLPYLRSLVQHSESIKR